MLRGCSAVMLYGALRWLLIIPRPLSSLDIFLVGAIGKAVATVLTYPYQVSTLHS
jgi:hypothetical protein